MNTSNSKSFDYSFKLLTLVLFMSFIALVFYSVQWYEAWSEIQTVQLHLSLE